MDFTLRPWRREDAGDLLRYANNEKIARNLRDVFPFPYILTDAQEFIESCLAADEEKRLFRALRWTATRWAASPCVWAATCTA